MLQFCGLLPISLTCFTLRGEVVQNYKCHTIYSILLALFFCIIYFLRIWAILVDMSTPSFYWTALKSRAEVFLAIANFFSTFICCIVSFYLAIFRLKGKIVLLKRLKEVDFILQKFTFHRPRILSFFNIFLVIALLVINIISVSNTFVDAAAQVSKLINTLALLEFMEIILNINDKFKMLNKLAVDVVLKSQSKHMVWTVILPSVETSNIPQSKTLNVSKLSEIHWNLCRLILDTADLYGPLLVVMMVYLFTHLIFLPYYLFLLQR